MTWNGSLKSWLDGVTSNPALGLRHRCFAHYRTDFDRCSRKWVAVPSRLPDDVQMQVHGFTKGFEATSVDTPFFRHFRAISTNWKIERAKTVPLAPAVHVLDEGWLEQVRRIGWLDART